MKVSKSDKFWIYQIQQVTTHPKNSNNFPRNNEFPFFSPSFPPYCHSNNVKPNTQTGRTHKKRITNSTWQKVKVQVGLTGRTVSHKSLPKNRKNMQIPKFPLPIHELSSNIIMDFWPQTKTWAASLTPPPPRLSSTLTSTNSNLITSPRPQSP